MIRAAVTYRDSDGSLVALGSTGTHESVGDASEPTSRPSPANPLKSIYSYPQILKAGKREVEAPRCSKHKLMKMSIWGQMTIDSISKQF